MVENLGESRKDHIKDHHTFITPSLLLKTGNTNSAMHKRMKEKTIRSRCLLSN